MLGFLLILWCNNLDCPDTFSELCISRWSTCGHRDANNRKHAIDISSALNWRGKCRKKHKHWARHGMATFVQAGVQAPRSMLAMSELYTRDLGHANSGAHSDATLQGIELFGMIQEEMSERNRVAEGPAPYKPNSQSESTCRAIGMLLMCCAPWFFPSLSLLAPPLVRKSTGKD